MKLQGIEHLIKFIQSQDASMSAPVVGSANGLPLLSLEFDEQENNDVWVRLVSRNTFNKAAETKCIFIFKKGTFRGATTG